MQGGVSDGCRGEISDGAGVESVMGARSGVSDGCRGGISDGCKACQFIIAP